MKAEELDFKQLEIMLAKYKYYVKETRLIELSIRYPVREEEENIGGGKSNVRDNDSMLWTLVKLEENEQLNEYIRIGKAIEKTYAELPEYLQACMRAFYIDRYGPYRGHARATAAKLNVDSKTLYRWRNKITEEFANNLRKWRSSEA